MRRAAFAIVIISLLAVSPQANELEHKIYLPIVLKLELDGTMGIWNFILPEATINHVLNPSAEIAGNNANPGGSTVTRVTTYSKFGIRSYRVQTAANGQGLRMNNMAPLANAPHYVSFFVRGAIPAGGLTVFMGNGVVATLLYDIDDEWSVYGRLVPAAQSVGQTTVDIMQNGVGAGDFYVDGIQVEERSARTTYCDGDQEGCEWLGAAHASQSQRSALSRAGGVVTDFDDYFFEIDGMFGPGMSPITLNVDSFAILPGGELNSQKTNVRSFTLTGWVRGTSLPDLHSHREELINALKPNATPEDQPVVLRYIGSTVIKEISAFYETGLEGAIRAGFECLEQNFSIRFLATDPNFYEIGESAEILFTSDTVMFRYLLGRLRATGQWDNLGVAAPGAVGAEPITAIIVGPDKMIYFSGDFTGWDGTGGAGSIDMVGRYNPLTGGFEQLGNAGDFGNIVLDLIFGPDGTLYAAGGFNVAGGDVADYLAFWNGAAWATVGVPVAGTAAITNASALAFDNNGILLVGGNFTRWADIGNADYIVQWDPIAAAYSLIGGVATGGTGVVLEIVIDSLDNIYIGGNFLNWNGDGDADRWARWDGAAWASVDAIPSTGTVFAMAITGDDVIYLGGAMTNMEGIPEADYIVGFDGQAIFTLGMEPADDWVTHIDIAPDGMLYASGLFTEIGGITLADRMAKWNGTSWAHLDADLPGATMVDTIRVGIQDPVVETNYDLFVGFRGTGNGTLAGIVTVTNGGTEDAYPRITIERTGGTSAVLEEIRNETLGLELLFDYGLLNGETLTIDLKPTGKSVISNFFGPRPDAILPNSDFGTWHLQSGDNEVSCFVNVVGAAIEAAIIFSDPYWSAD